MRNIRHQGFGGVALLVQTLGFPLEFMREFLNRIGKMVVFQFFKITVFGKSVGEATIQKK